MSAATLTAERARELLSYSLVSGKVYWLVNRRGPAKVGREAASKLTGPNGKSHRRVKLDGKHYYTHRVIWLIITGEWPTGEVDHFNGDGLCNAWHNLREATHAGNAQNLRQAHADSKTGLLGICPDGARFRAQIQVGRKIHYLGTHDTPEAAHSAYVEAKRTLHDNCTI